MHPLIENTHYTTNPETGSPPCLVLQLSHGVVDTLLPGTNVVFLGHSRLGKLVPTGTKQNENTVN